MMDSITTLFVGILGDAKQHCLNAVCTSATAVHIYASLSHCALGLLVALKMLMLP